MKFNDEPLTESECQTLTKVLIEGLRAVDGIALNLPIISGANIANTMYQVEILHHRDVQSVKKVGDVHRAYNVVLTIRTRNWIMKIPGDMDMRNAKTDLGFEAAELAQGTREQLQHDLTLAAMFIE